MCQMVSAVCRGCSAAPWSSVWMTSSVLPPPLWQSKVRVVSPPKQTPLPCWGSGSASREPDHSRFVGGHSNSGSATSRVGRCLRAMDRTGPARGRCRGHAPQVPPPPPPPPPIDPPVHRCAAIGPAARVNHPDHHLPPAAVSPRIGGVLRAPLLPHPSVSSPI